MADPLVAIEMCGQCGGKKSVARATGSDTRDDRNTDMSTSGAECTVQFYIPFACEVTRQSCEEVRAKISEINTNYHMHCEAIYSQKKHNHDTDIAIPNRPVINLVINSPGGDVFAGFYLYETIVASNSGKESAMINTICMGQAASAGFLIWLAGNGRYVLPSSLLMAHGGSTVLNGKFSDINRGSDMIQSVNKFINNVFNEQAIKDKLKNSDSFKEYKNNNQPQAEDEVYEKYITETFNDRDNYIDSDKLVSYNLVNDSMGLSIEYMKNHVLTPEGHQYLQRRLIYGKVF